MMTYEDKLYQLARKNENIMVLTAENRAAIRNMPENLGKRFIDTGITEQTMIGMAAGLALRGRIPVVHALASFLTMRAFEFIRTDIGISHLPVKLVGYVPGFLSEANGPTHQAIEDVSLMRSIPGMRIFCPADVDDLLIGLEDIVADPHPWYIRYNHLPAVADHYNNFGIGKSERFFSGNDITIIVYGTLFAQAYQACELLKENGIHVQLTNLRTLEPIDENSIISALLESNLVVTLEDHFSRGGLYSIVSEIAMKTKLQANVLPLDLQLKWFKPTLLNRLLTHEGFDAEAIAAKVYNYFNTMELQNVQYSAI